MFHVERITLNRILKGIIPIFLMIFVFNSCFTIKEIPKIADYHILNAENSKELKKEIPAVFMFENKKSKRSFQDFLKEKLNMKYENINFPVKIQNEKFVISVLNKIETEKVITLEDYIFNNPDKDFLKNGDQKMYVAISVIDKIGNDCLKNNSIYQNLVLNYLKELKLEYSTL